MKPTTPQLFLCLNLLLTVGGCADDAYGHVDTASTATFCRSAAEIGCATIYDCLTETERRARKLPETVPECERKLKADCQDAVDACPDATHEYAKDSAATCIDQMLDATCTDAGQAWLGASACKTVCERTGGALSVAWSFDPSYYDCSQLQLSGVRVVSIGGGQTYSDDYRCTVGTATTDVLPVGSYQVHIELFDNSGANVSQSSPVTADITKDVVPVNIVVPVAQR